MKSSPDADVRRATVAGVDEIDGTEVNASDDDITIDATLRRMVVVVGNFIVTSYLVTDFRFFFQ